MYFFVDKNKSQNNIFNSYNIKHDTRVHILALLLSFPFSFFFQFFDDAAVVVVVRTTYVRTYSAVIRCTTQIYIYIQERACVCTSMYVYIHVCMHV